MYLSKKLREVSSICKEMTRLEKSVISLNLENKELYELLDLKQKAIERIIEEKSTGFPWLANALAEYFEYKDNLVADYLENKKHPAYAKAEDVRRVAKENKELRKQLKIAKNFVLYYETLFPWLSDFVGSDLDELIEAACSSNHDEFTETDPVTLYLTNAEYSKMSTVERNQKALDRYLSSRKTSYAIGRDYERYIGYLFENQGYRVEYTGIEHGLEDLGRDLICTKGDEVEIVQCKYWAAHKTIHEKHINQLFGTAVKYCIDNYQIPKEETQYSIFGRILENNSVKASFYTSTKLSDTAMKFAKALSIRIVQSFPLQSYPLIKCNLGINNQKIYHLPFDQQYDKTRISKPGECYVSSVEEAESLGFRRAFRWRGDK